MSSAITAASEAVQQSIGGWAPENAVELDQFLIALPDLLESVSSSIHRVASRLGDEFPVERAVIEHLQDVAATVAGMCDYVGEAHGIHRRVHEKEIERIEQPRPNEAMWDVSKQ